jgi:hypothetical protein
MRCEDDYGGEVWEASMLVSKYYLTTWKELSKSKAVPLDAMEALGGRRGIAPTHSRPRH